MPNNRLKSVRTIEFIRSKSGPARLPNRTSALLVLNALLLRLLAEDSGWAMRVAMSGSYGTGGAPPRLVFRPPDNAIPASPLISGEALYVDATGCGAAGGAAPVGGKLC
jgi:hypothetical protein